MDDHCSSREWPLRKHQLWEAGRMDRRTISLPPGSEWQPRPMAGTENILTQNASRMEASRSGHSYLGNDARHDLRNSRLQSSSRVIEKTREGRSFQAAKILTRTPFRLYQAGRAKFLRRLHEFFFRLPRLRAC